MTLQLAQPAPVPIRPCHGDIYRLDGGHHRLMNGTGLAVVAHIINAGAGPATVAGCIAGAAGALVIEGRNAFMVGWDVRGTTWRALRMCGALIAVSPEDFPPGVRPYDGPVPADADFLVEALDGSTARCTLSTISAYLAGTLSALPGPQSAPVWGSHE